MDTKDLFNSCKRGDIERIRNLVNVREVELNVRDKWDSTPLYYACLCGHTDVVRYLLENGAKCEANTFDGERCLYGALNDEIRNILRGYKVITASLINRDSYETFLRCLQDNKSYADIIFNIHGYEFPAHRCILAARSEYFAETLMNKWCDEDVIYLNHKKIFPKAFRSILEYIYTGYLRVSLEYVDDCLLLAKQCCLQRLHDDLSERFSASRNFQSHKPGINVTTICVDSTSHDDLKMHFGFLADLAIPPELSNFIIGELPFEHIFPPLYADVVFNVAGYYFDCHKVFFSTRSDYFRALLTDHFGERDESGSSKPVITLYHVSPKIFLHIVRYVYQHSCQVPPDEIIEVLHMADIYLLTGLKRLCGSQLASTLTTRNVVSLLYTARLFSLPRLLDSCYQFIANNLSDVITQEEFSELVVEDARNIRNREEADSIDVIDEVRYHITSYVRTMDEVMEAKEKLDSIDRLLEHLDLEG